MDGPRLNTRFRVHLWLRFLVFFALFLVPAVIGLGEAGQGGLRTIWIISSAAFFGLVLPAVLCRHCPHYARPGWVIVCPSTVGPPKLLKATSRPVSGPEKIVFGAGFGLIIGFPVGVLAVGGELFWAALALLGGGLFFVLERRFSCSRCLNFSCVMNQVPEGVKQSYGPARPSTRTPSLDIPSPLGKNRTKRRGK